MGVHGQTMNESTPSSTAPLTRRRILGWGGVGLLAGVSGYLAWPRRQGPVVSPSAGAGRPGASGMSGSRATASSAVGELSGRNAFLPHLQSEFDVESIACRLIEVSPEMEMKSPTARFVSFSLLFSAPADFSGESRIYRLNHPQMGPMDLLLSPVGRSDEHVHLEAVFSQRV